MAVPVIDTSHVVEARAKLTDFFRGQHVVQGILDSWIQQVQLLENAVFDVIDKRMLDAATFAQLDSLGSLVGEPRLGRPDDIYREAIRLRILVNRSQGRAEDVIKVAGIATADNFTYEEVGTANWEVTAFESVIWPVLLAHLLGQTKAAATRGLVIYSTWPAAEDFVFGSDAGTAPNERNLGTVYTSFVSRLAGVFEAVP